MTDLVQDDSAFYRRRELLLPLLADLLLQVGHSAFLFAFFRFISLQQQGSVIAAHVFGCSQAGYVLSLLVGGYLTSRFGQHRVILASLMVYMLLPLAVYRAGSANVELLTLGALSGLCGGLSSPAARVQLYGLIPQKYLGAAFLALQLLSLVGAAGYLVGHVLEKVSPLAPYVFASGVAAAATVLFGFSPHERIVSQGEETLSLTDLRRLVTQYLNRQFLFPVGLMVLLSLGSSIFYFAGLFRLLREPTAGQDIATLMATVLVLTILCQSLLRWTGAAPLAIGLVCVPVLALLATVNYDKRLPMMALWAVFGVTTYGIRMYLFSGLSLFLDTRSGIHTSLFQMSTVLGSLLSYGLLAYSVHAWSIAYTFAAYAVLFVAAVVSMLLLGGLPRSERASPVQAAADPQPAGREV